MRKKTQISTCSKNHCPDMATFLGGTVVGTMVGILASRLATRPSGQKDASPNPDLNPAPVQVHTDLLRAISHDLRTPLSNIMGNSLIYLENHGTLEEQERLRLVSRIHEDSSWLIDMAENLLAITRLEDIGLLLSAREEIWRKSSAKPCRSWKSAIPTAQSMWRFRRASSCFPWMPY